MPTGARTYSQYSIQTRLPCCIAATGYIFVKHPETGKWVREHRYVFEQYCGKIPKNKDIHHIDENPSNNILSNLQEKWHPKHISDHMIGNNYGKGCRKFTDTHKPCRICKKMLPHADFGKHKSRAGGLQNACWSCNREYHRQYRAKRKVFIPNCISSSEIGVKL